MSLTSVKEEIKNMITQSYEKVKIFYTSASLRDNEPYSRLISFRMLTFFNNKFLAFLMKLIKKSYLF